MREGRIWQAVITRGSCKSCKPVMDGKQKQRLLLHDWKSRKVFHGDLRLERDRRTKNGLNHTYRGDRGKESLVGIYVKARRRGRRTGK